MTIKAVIFDVGGVLHLPQYKKVHGGKLKELSSVHIQIANKFGMDLDGYFRCVGGTLSDSTVGRINKTQTVKRLAELLRANPKKIKKVYLDAYKKRYDQNKPMHKFALGLKKKGYKIGILSDQWAISKEGVIEKKLMSKFDSVVISTDVKMTKPNPKIYKLILKRLKVRAKETLFIDNRAWNLRPAKKLGMKTILFKNNKQFFKEIKKFGLK